MSELDPAAVAEKRSAPRAPLVLVSVGTDHHPFDRLMRWVDRWLASRPQGSVRCFVQAGTSTPPRLAEHAPLVSHGDLQSLFDEAAVVVSHGGPGTIMESRRRATTPIVVPRRSDLGEHVDDHQVRFARRLAAAGQVELAETEERFREALESALARPRRASDTAPRGVPEGVQRFTAVADHLLSTGSVQPRTSPLAARVRVLYIGGWGRSGSTLLDRMLGQMPGFVSIGEMRDGWLRGCIEDRLCGCGESFRSCRFWRQVGERAFGGWDRADPERLQELRRIYDRPWMLPLLAFASSGPRPRGLRRYVSALADLYTAIGQVSGARVIVDSSKIPSYALLLRATPTVDLRVVHLVRDARGVVYSWQKRVERPDAPGRTDYMLRYGAVSASIRYVLYNQQTHMLRWLGVPYRLLRYEDLVADPRRYLLEVVGHAGIGADPSWLDFLDADTAALGTNHTVDGNPIRFASGPLRIRADEEWRRRLPVAQRRIVTALTAPMLRRYGYATGSGPGLST